MKFFLQPDLAHARWDPTTPSPHLLAPESITEVAEALGRAGQQLPSEDERQLAGA